MTLQTWDFEGQTSGTNLTTTSSTPTLSAVSPAGTTKYGTTSVFSGATSVTSTVGTANTASFWRAILNSNLVQSFGGAVSYNAIPSSVMHLVTFRTTAGISFRISVAATSGDIRIFDAGNTNFVRLLAASSPNTRYYISARLTAATATTGTYTVSIYDSSNTLLNTISSTTYNLGTAPFAFADFGVIDTAQPSGRAITWDYIRFDDGSTTELTPAMAPVDVATFAGASTLTVAAVPGQAAGVALSGSSTLVGGTSTSYAATAALTGSSTLTATASAPKLTGAAALAGTSTLTATPTTPITLFLARLAAQAGYVAHRGGSADWAEGTLYAYNQAAAWNADLALEISMWKSLDGYWVSSHDQTTGRVFAGTSYDIKTTNWVGTLENLVSIIGGKPISLVTDILNAHATGNRVIFVDDKGQQDLTGFFAMLASYGGPARFVIKAAGNGTVMATNAASRGYQSWGYFYPADTAANLATFAPGYTLLGEDATVGGGSSSTDWTAIKSYGKPVLAHILATAADKAKAISLGADGFMASGVQEVVPQTPATLVLSGTSTLTAGGSAGRTDSAALAGSSSMTAVAKPGQSASPTLSGVSSLTTSASQSVVATVTLAGSSSMSAAAHAGAVAAPTLAGFSSLTATTRAGVAGGATLSGQSAMVASSSVAFLWAALFVGQSLLTATSSTIPARNITVTIGSPHRNRLAIGTPSGSTLRIRSPWR